MRKFLYFESRLHQNSLFLAISMLFLETICVIFSKISEDRKQDRNEQNQQKQFLNGSDLNISVTQKLLRFP